MTIFTQHIDRNFNEKPRNSLTQLKYDKSKGQGSKQTAKLIHINISNTNHMQIRKEMPFSEKKQYK